MAHAGGGLAQAQSLGRLAVGELLEVAEQDDLAVSIVKIVEGRTETVLQLSPQRLGRGGERGSRSWAARSSEDWSANASEPRIPCQGPLAIQAPLAGPAVPAVGIDHLVASDLPQPEVKRQRRVPQVFTQPLAGLQEHVLDDVAGIDPPAQRLVQPQPDHPPEGRAVAFPEFVRGGRVGLLNLLQEPLGFSSHLATSVTLCPGRPARADCPSYPALERSRPTGCS